MIKIIFTIIILSFHTYSVAAAPKLVLGYPEFRPYTYSDGSSARGLAMPWLQQIAKNLDVELQLEPIESYGTGFNWLKMNKIDGLFLASQNAQRDDVAVFSKPLTENRWAWFYLRYRQLDVHSDRAKERLRIATPTQANTHTWLLENGYQQIMPTTDVHAMLRLLLMNRIDTVFIAEEVFNSALNDAGVNKVRIQNQVEKSKPFGIYISKRYLENNAEFMVKLNKSIDDWLAVSKQYITTTK